MAIDTRATTHCNLGTVISASISDDYIQGNGLIKTTGNVEIDGIITPSVGQGVIFSYIRNGTTYQIPRKLRVLSSFADPFRRTTQVELGCKLTYLSDLREPLKWKPSNDPQNADITEEDQKIITAPIFASSVMNRCLDKLNITSSSNPLNNIFSIGEFDYSNGYVNILSDLLVSESYCGYLNQDEILQIINLDRKGGTGRVLESSNIIDVASINSGELPAEAVVVSYSSLKLKNSQTGQVETEQPVDAPTETIAQASAFVSWERSQNTSLEEKTIEYEPYFNLFTDGEKVTRYYSVIAYSEEIATYKQFIKYKDSLTKTEVQDPQQQGDITYEQGPQIQEEKRLIDKRVTTSKTSLVSVAPNAVARLLTYYVEPGNDFIEQITTEYYYYDENGEERFRVTEVDSDLLTAFASLSVDTVYELFDGQNDDRIKYGSLTYNSGEFSFSIPFSYINIYNLGRYISQRTVIETVRIGKLTKTITTTYGPWSSTARGQQLSAETKSIIKTPTDALAHVQYMCQLSKLKTEVSLTGEQQPVPEEAPLPEDITNSRNVDTGNRLNPPNPANDWKAESTTESVFIIGNGGAQRRKEFSLPYASDDYFMVGVLPGGERMYSSAPSGATERAKKFGRIQNKLLLGNRNGINIQALPEELPSIPFSPVIVQANGLSAMYRSNAFSWTMDANGVIASIDALFWGAVGGTGDFWFPVAPGIVTLPTTPPIIDGEMTVEDVTPVWNETSFNSAITRTKIGVRKFPYKIQNLTDISVITNTLIDVTKQLKLAVPISTITISGVVPTKVGRMETRILTTTKAIDIIINPPRIASGGLIAAPSRGITIAAPVPTSVGYINPINALSPVLWYDFDDATTVTLSSTTITQITDKGSRGWTLTKSTTGPTQANWTNNSRKCCDWGSSSHSNYLRNTSTTSTAIAEIYVVLDAAFGSTFPGYNGLLSDTVDNTNDLVVVATLPGATSLDTSDAGSFNAAYLNGSASNSVSAVLPTINSPTLMRLKKTSDAAVNTTDGFQIGTDRNNANRGWYGLVAEVVCFSSVLSSTDRTNVQNHLAAKWGLTLV